MTTAHILYSFNIFSYVAPYLHDEEAGKAPSIYWLVFLAVVKVNSVAFKSIETLRWGSA